ACNSQDEALSSADDSDIIHVGGVSTGDMVTTAAVSRAAVSAETIDWLKAGLQKGMTISYYQDADAKQQAQLRLDENGIYSLTDANKKYAKWLGNGAHVFEGVYVPAGLGKDEPHIYDSLSHYTAVPPSTKIAATVGRITIPLQHRLARVVAYVLIDKDMAATLKGFDTKNDDNNKNVENTMLRFCNVQTLDYVENEKPVWKTERKAIPHYLGQESVKLYKEKATGKLVFPIDDNYADAAADTKSYTCLDYGMCPYYDLIVRPTYTVNKDKSNVMFDEAVQTASGENNIDFELTLSNDLEYEKSFAFDLNANDETVVYLRVSPERIDYNSAGSRLWKESSYPDNYYGVNNQNGNNLSVAGSSWQRAYTNSTLNTGVTDGHFYDADNEDEEAQYVDDTKWFSMLLQAYKGGAHHGDYFILKKDITINTDDFTFPYNYIFTGHLDAFDHKITVTGSRAYLFDGLDGEYTTAQETDKASTWEANVHLEGSTWVPTLGWRAEIVNTNISGATLFKDGAPINGYVNNCSDKNGVVTNYIPTIPTYSRDEY
nr:hypothetical protein [Prevotella sp.]